MRQVAVKAHDHQHEAWKAAAASAGVSMGEFIRQAVDQRVYTLAQGRVYTQVYTQEPSKVYTHDNGEPERPKLVRKPKIIQAVDPFEGCEVKGGNVLCPHCDLEPTGFPRAYVEEKQTWVCCQTPLATMVA